jgi:hypothetical protein
MGRHAERIASGGGGGRLDGGEARETLADLGLPAVGNLIVALGRDAMRLIDDPST